MSHAMLAEIWLWTLAVILAAVVILDGFDLGVGIMCLLEKDESRREAMMDSIEGVWHANQTWLVIAGGVLFGAFPLAYGMLLSSLYLPAGLLLLALMARGIGLEYYYHAQDRRAWSTLFGVGSLAVAMVEGAMLGAVIQGVPMSGHHQFLNPFGWVGGGALLGALAMACLTGALGAGWAASNSGGFAKHQAAMLCVLGSVAFQAWLAAILPVSGLHALALAVVSVGFAAWAVTAMDSGRRFFLPLCAHALLALVAWLLALRPGFTAPGLTPLTASAAPGSLTNMLTGFGIFLPIIVAYTIYQYRVFRTPLPAQSSPDR
ncbi:MAG: cytochrome d ubiquinol oxidase subunit II [Thermodesulfobacteriota bacterium]